MIGCGSLRWYAATSAPAQRSLLLLRGRRAAPSTVSTAYRHHSSATPRLLAWWSRTLAKTTDVATVHEASHAVRDVRSEKSASSSSGSNSDSHTPVKLRTARPSPRALSQVKQKPLFPGMFRHVSMFEGEHVYHYGTHTFTIFKESLAMGLIPGGCLLGFIATHAPNCPVIPFEYQCLYLLGVMVLARFVAAGRRTRRSKDLTGRHVVVTGGTSGIGRATAAQLAKMGADITLVARDSPHAKPATNYVRGYAKDAEAQTIRFQALDLEDFIAVRDFCKRARHTHAPIDILVNAAGCVRQQKTVTRFGDDVQLAVNFLGPYLLTEGLLPLVEAAHGRIVYVSCSAHVGVKGNAASTYLSGRGVWSSRVADKFDALEQYGFTKLGNIFHAQQLALRSYPEYQKGTVASRLTRQQPLNAAGTRKSSTAGRRSGYADATAAAAAATSTTSNSKSREESAAAAVRIEPGFTACACSPGGVITNLYRDIALASTFHYLYYVYVFVMRTAWEGSQTVVDCCVRDDFKNGGYYMNTRYQPAGLSKAACSVAEREQVMAWTANKMKAYMKWD